MSKCTLILVRHGESEWDKKNLFNGWYDDDLTVTGTEQARYAGEALKKKGFTFDVAFTSILRRAVKTLYLMQEVRSSGMQSAYACWRGASPSM